MRLLYFAISAAMLLTGALADVPYSTDAATYDSGVWGITPNQTFRSSPIVAPVFQINRFDRDALDSAPYLFLDWNYNGTYSPMIFRSDDLSLVYADPRYSFVSNVRAQTIEGRPHLTFWKGEFGFGVAGGCAVVFDETYRLRYNMTAVGLPSDVLTDLHEFQFTNEGTAIISIYQKIPYDLSFMGGDADGLLLDSLFQEIDPETNKAVFTWRASDHWRPEDSHAPLPMDVLRRAFDFYHINSIAKYNGNYLVNSRRFSHATLVNGSDGSIIWTLGGRFNDFEDLSGGRATGFRLHHYARFGESDREITLFDNHAMHQVAGCTADCSRGLHVRLDYDAMTAEVVREYFHPVGLQSYAMGSYAALESGNVLVGWGSQPAITEFREGSLVMDVQTGPLTSGISLEQRGAGGYRAYKMDWVGRPSWGPSIAFEGGTVYLSWNGATEVESWIVRGADAPDAFDSWWSSAVARSVRRGFETEIELEAEGVGRPRYLRAVALGSWNIDLGMTPVLDSFTGEIVANRDNVMGYKYNV